VTCARPTSVPDGFLPQAFPGVAHHQNDAQVPGPPQFRPDPTDEFPDHFPRRTAAVRRRATTTAVAAA